MRYWDLLVDGGTDVHETGELALVGSLACVECGYSISLSLSDELPSCPACGGSRFRRASMFEPPTVDADAISPAPALPAWLERGARGPRAGKPVRRLRRRRRRAGGRGAPGRLEPDRAQRLGRHPARRRDRVAPPRADRPHRRTTSCALSTTAASTACSSTASESSGRRWSTATSSRSAATGSTCSRPTACRSGTHPRPTTPEAKLEDVGGVVLLGRDVRVRLDLVRDDHQEVVRPRRRASATTRLASASWPVARSSSA